MVDGIGKGGGLAREAILAALRSQASQASQVRERAGELGSVGDAALADQAAGTSFTEKLAEGLRAVDDSVKNAEALPEELVAGEVDRLPRGRGPHQGGRAQLPLRDGDTEQADRRLPRSHAHDRVTR